MSDTGYSDGEFNEHCLKTYLIFNCQTLINIISFNQRISGTGSLWRIQ